jgi:hypothetical protein
VLKFKRKFRRQRVKEESIKAVKTVRGVLIKRSLHQSPDHSVPSARAICKHGEIYKKRKIHSAVWRWGYSVLISVTDI